MEKGLEFFDAWAKAQREFLETSLKSQEVFRNSWLDSMKKAQETFLHTANGFDTPQSKEIVKLFNIWFETTLNSSQIFSDEVLKIQHSWEKALEKQVDQSKELIKGFSEFLKQAEQK